VSDKFALIDAEKAMFAIVKMCEWLSVSTSGFYDWLNRSASATAQRRTHLAALIQAGESTPRCSARATAAAPSWSETSSVSWA
jgi:hypothetical protein